jgi:N-acyl-D-amino-acid deacylase
MYDVLIRNGTLFDGTQSAPLPADVAVQGDHIVAVAPNLPGSAQLTIDAAGKAVSPGFIDMHTHSDFSLLVEPDGDSKLRQGVTTEVVGNCGDAPAPAYGPWVEELEHNFSAKGLQVTWHTFGEYLANLAQLKPILNVIPLVGHGAIRGSVMGIENRRPTPAELARMKELTKAALDEGAWGMSTGLIYPPGELARVVQQAGGFYASHVRGEGRTVFAAVNEAIEVGRRAELPVQVSHLKISGYRTWDRIEELLKIVDDAVAQGGVYFDQYPYAASSTFLLGALPEWTYVGGAEAAARRLADPAVRRQLRDYVEQSPAEFWDYAGTRDWEGILITNYPPNPGYQGLTVADVARQLDNDPFDTLLDLLVEAECVADCVLFDQHEPNVQQIMQHELVMVGSDGYSVKADGYMGKCAMHPRSYGTFPRVLGRYTREQRLLSWPQAIYKMTGLPARALGISDRGVLRPGAYADIVILDPETVLDQATFTQAHQYPIGIEHVFIDGQHAVKDGKTTGIRAGMVL